MSTGASEAFYEASLDADVPAGPDMIARIDEAAGDPHFGFIMEDNLRAAAELLQHEDGSVLPGDVPAAMGTLAVVLHVAGADYRQSGRAPDPDGSAWLGHRHNVRAGEIELLTPDFWTSVTGGRNQAQFANSVLNRASPGVEPVLARLNYSLYFGPGTMAGASKTLTKPPEEVAASTQQAEMPHLSVANWAVAETVQHLYEALAAGHRGRMHVVDMCSGSGATLAAITNRLDLARDTGRGLDDGRLSLTGFETTPMFYKQLIGDYLPAAQPQLEALGIRAVEMATVGVDFDRELQPGRINLVEGDVVEGVADLDLSTVAPHDLVVGTANYGFHRLPSRRKTEIIGKLAETANSVLIIGDLRQNGSAVNRGYFNLSNNGPLNPGNIGLEEELDRHGYATFTIGSTGFEPRFVDKVLRERLLDQLGDDGFVTIAVKGRKAHQLLHAT